jgi:outer membrane receptor protein involved in Fe transport
MTPTRPTRTYFQLTAANEVSGYRNRVNGSKRMTEAIYAPYVRFDLNSLLDRRLNITGGVRFEQTEFKGVGPLINPTAIYSETLPATSSATRRANPWWWRLWPRWAGTQLAYIERGSASERSYGDLYPSLNASFNFRSNLIAACRTPNRSRDQTSITSSVAEPARRDVRCPTVTLTNPNLEPWEADSYGVALEYYFDEKTAGLALGTDVSAARSRILGSR